MTTDYEIEKLLKLIQVKLDGLSVRVDALSDTTEAKTVSTEVNTLMQNLHKYSAAFYLPVYESEHTHG